MPSQFETQRVFVITGAMAAGKSTVAEALARRIAKSVHVRGDLFRKMIVNGAAKMGPQLGDEAVRQLALRHELACVVARRYHEAGFTVIYQDIIVGEALDRTMARLADLRPTVVALVPSAEVLLQRDRARFKTGYGADFPPAILADAFAAELPEGVLKIDTSTMTVEQVVAHILAL
jgi:cytidylate kinase